MKNLDHASGANPPANGHTPSRNSSGAPAAAGSPIPTAWWCNRPTPSAPNGSTTVNLTDRNLLLRAKEINRTLDPRLAKFEAHYGRFHPVLRSALARETTRLARAAHVRECAAFLALVTQFEN